MKFRDLFSFGDLVTVDLSASHGTAPTTAVVIGRPHYAGDKPIVTVASSEGQGMPVNECWLHKTGRAEDRAAALRHAYLSKFPTALEGLPYHD